MMYIDEFNEMTGTKYTKESFIKLFNQYFPNGHGRNQEAYNNSYKKMYEHAIRFAVRSYVFSDEKNTDVRKVADGLNTLFEEQIDDYNKLQSAKGKNDKKITFLKDGGMSKDEINQNLLKSVDDIPKTTKEEELQNLKNGLKFRETLSDDDTFKKMCFNRIGEILGANSLYSIDEKTNRCADIMNIMADRLNSHDKNYKLTHPLKYSDEKKSIEDIKNQIVNNGVSENSLDDAVNKPSGKNSLYKSIEDNINGISQKSIDNFDFRKALGQLTSDDLQYDKSSEVSNVKVIDKNLSTGR